MGATTREVTYTPDQDRVYETRKKKEGPKDIIVRPQRHDAERNECCYKA